MLDIRTIRDNLNDVAARLKVKGFDLDIEKFQQLDKARSAALTSAQQLQAEKKKASKQIGQLIGQGMTPDEAKAQS
jgi:seryl-tRNA synthetase